MKKSNRYAEALEASRKGTKVQNAVWTMSEDREVVKRLRQSWELMEKCKRKRQEIDAAIEKIKSLRNEIQKADERQEVNALMRLSTELSRLDSIRSSFSRPGAKARFANWETNLTKKYGKPIEEHTAKIGRNSWKIEVAEAMDGSVVANLFLWNDNRGFEHFESGSLQGLRSLAERISRSDAAGIAKINRIANYSRPGAKAHGLTLAQRIAVEHDAKRMALR